MEMPAQLSDPQDRHVAYVVAARQNARPRSDQMIGIVW
jgi:hypothetical protein